MYPLIIQQLDAWAKELKMSTDSININGIEFKWGMTFEQIINVFKSENLSTGWSSWKSYEIECNEIANLKSLTCFFWGPSINRPIMQCSFELAPLKLETNEEVHTPYVRHLTGIFGNPHNSSFNKLENGQKYNEGYASSNVIFSCEWWQEDILISLSVFGGIRIRKEGNYAAGLYFQWFNEKKAAEPYYEEFFNTEGELLASVTLLNKFELEYNQRPYFRSHYELKDSDIALKDESVRAAQLALYTNSLYRMPERISDNLKKNEIVLFYSEGIKNWCIGNKWDFTVIDNEESMEYISIKRARGPGGTEMNINSLKIVDVIESNNLKELSCKIEEFSGRLFKRKIGYDD